MQLSLLHIISYISLIILLLFIALRIHKKVTLTFWSTQPVLHFYDLHNWIKPRGVIEDKLPKFNKFCNSLNILTEDINQISGLDKQKIINFLNNNYLNTKLIKQHFSLNKFMSHFSELEHTSYISTYKKTNMLVSQKNIAPNTNIKYDKQLIGLITSKALNVTFKNKDPFAIYYMDYLCVDRNERNKGIAPQIIQTHIYNQRQRNSSIKVSFFKRESKLTNIVPFVLYKSYRFSIDKLTFVNSLASTLKVIEITKLNIRLLLELIICKKDYFDCMIYPDISNILSLIEANNIHIYGIINNDALSSVYIFKESNISYDNNLSINLISTINNCDENSIFISGFVQSIKHLLKKINVYTILIEDISNNDIIIENLLKKSTPLIVSPTAFYFYNYLIKTIYNNSLFIIY